MPTIPGATDRGVRLLPGLTGGQALGLAATAAAAWLAWRSGWALPLRTGSAALIGLGGAVYALGRWPAGPGGDRLAVWLPRAAAFLLMRRRRAGRAVVGWDGLEGLEAELLRHRGGWACVLEVGGADFALRGPGAAQAAQAALRELLHATGSPLQIVGLSRAVRGADRPADWDADRAPPGLAAVARAYAQHWDGLVAGRAALWRRCFLVLTVPPGAGGRPSPRLMALEAAAVQFGERVGLPVRRVRGKELIALLREAGGSADLRQDPDPDGAWKVGEFRG